MKAQQLTLDTIKRLTREEMKKITGGSMPAYQMVCSCGDSDESIVCKYGEEGGGKCLSLVQQYCSSKGLGAPECDGGSTGA
jgi:hypothetical protein